MSEIAIKVENLGKKYHLKHQQTDAEDSLVRSLFKGTKNLLRSHSKNAAEEFWALQAINFEIKKGDRVGIVGRNGAGKSTLLKILSRIVKPTTGRIEYEGRMASLLEVGTGFHGDLSGRENIFLNGSILGMTKTEIEKQFDEIVAFSEVEQFLDTPVKRYSSGMYVRLAFAVAAHLNPEILIVDEVLAVGDAAFQKKCIGKMNDISKAGDKTILFVSHSMQAVQKLCNTGIYLSKGKLMEHGSIDSIINRYLHSGEQSQSIYQLQKPDSATQGYAETVYIESEKGQPLMEIPVGDNWRVRITINLTQDVEHFIGGMGIVSALDQPIRTTWTKPLNIKKGNYELIFTNNDLMLTTGTYKIVIGLSSNERTFHYDDSTVSLNISDAGDTANNNRIVNTQSGLILNPMPYEFNQLN
ncbi:MAG: ABC transporter ATP-binding protein [Bacteroidetes bacterium]|nr:ABC transporter ATP-binding protein [Bacteroidota bacterium]